MCERERESEKDGCLPVVRCTRAAAQTGNQKKRVLNGTSRRRTDLSEMTTRTTMSDYRYERGKEEKVEEEQHEEVNEALTNVFQANEISAVRDGSTPV